MTERHEPPAPAARAAALERACWARLALGEAAGPPPRLRDLLEAALAEAAAEAYQRGHTAARRHQPSGCVCLLDEAEGRVVEPCAAHAAWREAAVAAERAACAAVVEAVDAAIDPTREPIEHAAVSRTIAAAIRARGAGA